MKNREEILRLSSNGMQDRRESVPRWRTTLGWLCLIAFVILGYSPAMYCRDILLLGYSPPANHAQTVQQFTMLTLTIACYSFYMGFLITVMRPIAIRRVPEKPDMTSVERHELENHRFLFSLIPSFFLIAGMALLDDLLMSRFPGAQTAYRMVEQLIGLVV